MTLPRWIVYSLFLVAAPSLGFSAAPEGGTPTQHRKPLLTSKGLSQMFGVLSASVHESIFGTA